MKRGTKTRTLGLTLSTVNPCNNFIVDFLLRNKIKSDKQILCKSYLYNLAIESVRKYPLPLICVEQLDALEGFGDFFINQIGRIIRRQYLRGRNPTQEEMQRDDADHFKALRTRSQYVQEKNRFNRQRVDHNRDLDSLYQDEATSNVSIASSASCSKGRQYRPKKNSESYNVLEAMVELKADVKSISKGEINEYFYNNHKNKISSWYIVRQKLLNYQFIQAGDGNCDEIYLTQKGKQCITKYDEFRKKKDRRKKKFLEEVQEQSDQLDKSSQENQSQGNAKQDKESEGNDKQSQKSKSKGNFFFSDRATTSLKRLNIETGLQLKNQKIVPNLKTLTLLISTKNQNASQMEQHFQVAKIKHKLCHLELGSFIWSVESKITNYMAFRFDVSKFEEQDFMSQCLRVKAVGLKFVYLIVQGEQENHEGEERERILACARVSGFNVFKTDSITGTLRLISQITNFIMRNLRLCEKSEVNIGNFKIRLNEQLKGFEHYGCLEEFNSKLSAPFKLQNVTAKMINQIPNLSRGQTLNLLKRIDYFSLFYRKLNGLTEKQRSRKLKGYLGDKHAEKGVKTILQLVFKQEY